MKEQQNGVMFSNGKTLSIHDYVILVFLRVIINWVSLKIANISGYTVSVR